MAYLVLGLVLFLGTHSLPMFPDADSHLKARLGEGAFKGIFSLVSVVGLVFIVIGYGDARFAGPALLYEPPVWLAHLVMLLMLPVFILVLSTYLPGRIKAGAKHPTILAVKIWAFAHLLANGDAASVLLFGSFLAWAVADRISLKRRGMPGGVAPGEGALRNDVAAIAGGLVIYGLFVWQLHSWLIGVPILPA
ncbi:NnrU family protein [Rhizobiales bacterium]|uniref:NnrU family protein n=1 Tax=Hongsoonwoonella zoysiae TaxID=2821844 RepID=UPI0015606248|nr:NnrU family protein [Hongsoonwoonella zoysiae]NRG18965.1 NnrU family protein [Hongsoonwoonella zoysiae]